MANYVYTMNRVGKIVPPKRQILKDISLSFFPGAKIGVLGLNGSGKSTLLKIMAGIDTDIQGEAVPMPGLNIGYLPQEPVLDPEHTVRQAVERGARDLVMRHLIGSASPVERRDEETALEQAVEPSTQIHHGARALEQEWLVHFATQHGRRLEHGTQLAPLSGLPLVGRVKARPRKRGLVTSVRRCRGTCPGGGAGAGRASRASR